jgi:nicotinamidase-related amidase
MTIFLDKLNTALLVIDVQQELFEKSTPIYRPDLLLQNINSLINRSRQAGVPVVFVQHCADKYLITGSRGWELHNALQQMPEDLILHKRHPNAFEETNLRDELVKRGVTTLIIAGLVTHGCVKATCLGALAEGYFVVLAGDAHSSYSKDAPQLIEKWNDELEKKGAKVIKTQQISF